MNAQTKHLYESLGVQYPTDPQPEPLIVNPRSDTKPTRIVDMIKRRQPTHKACPTCKGRCKVVIMRKDVVCTMCGGRGVISIARYRRMNGNH